MKIELYIIDSLYFVLIISHNVINTQTAILDKKFIIETNSQSMSLLTRHFEIS